MNWISLRSASRSARARAGLCLALGVTTVCAACGTTSASKATAANGATASLTMNLDGPVNSFDPALGGSYQSFVTDAAMYDTLVASDNGKLIPDLASKWSSTTTTANFTIRDGVTCSDGEKLTGDVVAASLNRFFAPATGAPLLNAVIGNGNSAHATADGQRVTITLKNPFSELVPALTMPMTGIVCTAGINDPKSLTTGSDGTGGYVAKSQVAGASYTFSRRAGYTWGPVYSGVPTAGVRPAELVMKVVSDENTRASLQLTGKMQIADYSTNDWQRVAAQSGWAKIISQQSNTYLMLNQAPGHLTDNKAVRTAIVQALNISQLNDAQSFGAGKLISDFGQPGDSCYDPSLKSLIPQTNLSAAKKVLTGKNIAVMGSTILAGGAGNKYVETALHAAGANVTLRNLPNDLYASDQATGKNDWDVSIAIFANVTPTLGFSANFFSGTLPPKGTNFSNINNPTAVAQLKAYYATSGQAACSHMVAYQKALFQNVQTIPLATAPATVMFAPGVTAMVQTGFVQPETIRVASK